MEKSYYPASDTENLFIVRNQQFLDRPTIIFLHDSLGCVQLWRDFPERLCAALKCNLLIYDRLGYGQSTHTDTILQRDYYYMHHEADVLLDIINHYDIKHPILFGHSDGGTIALLAGAKRPNLIKAIVTEGAHVIVEEITLQGVKAAKVAYSTTDIATRLAKYHGDRVENIYRAWNDIWLDASFKNWDITKEINTIDCPTLVIQGSEDEFGTLKQVELIVNNVPKAQSYIMDGEGHSPHKRSGKLVIKACKDFFN